MSIAIPLAKRLGAFALVTALVVASQAGNAQDGDGAQPGHMVPYFPIAADGLREGFVSVVNRSGRPGEVEVHATDAEGNRFPPTTLALGADETVHFNSADLEQGNEAKGLPMGIGPGTGDWWLTLTSGLDIDVLSYVRTPRDGFLTAMHDVVPREGRQHRVAIFNPGHNANQVSLLRLVNSGDEPVEVTVAGIDDGGDRSSGTVSLSVPAGNSRTLTARQIESGSDGFEGKLGDGTGKWQLIVESDRPITVMSLLRSPTGHLTNLSTAPAVDFAPVGSRVFADRVAGRRMVGDDPARSVDFLAGGRFRETDGSATYEGTYNYTRAGTNQATVVFSYDDGGRCTYELTFASRTAGRGSYTCEDRRSGASGWHLIEPPVAIPDANLRAAVEHHLGKAPGDPITAADMETLTSLVARGIYDDGGIGDLEGIQFAVNLEKLDIRAAHWDAAAGQWRNLNEVSDLSPLSRLTRLVWLDLGGSNDRIRDLSPLSRLSGLEEFHCWNCNITDLTPLSGLVEMRSMKIVSNDRLSDLTPLSGLVNLTSLQAAYCDIGQLTPLSKLTNLVELSLDFNHGDGDLSPLSGLTKLRVLSVSGNAVTDLSPLSGLTQLRTLDVGWNDLENLSPLSELTELQSLLLSKNKIADLSPLRGLTSLVWLWLAENRLVDLSPLRELTNLGYLDLRDNRISDVSPLIENPGLAAGDTLDLHDNPLGGVSIETHLPALVERGVNVLFSVVDVVVDADHRPTIFDDKVFVLPVTGDLLNDPPSLRRYAETFYEYFEDEFDFLFFLENLDFGEAPRGFFGRHEAVGNDVQGIGLSHSFDTGWGSGGRLQSILHFPYYFAMGNGPTLHEVMHRWANFVIDEYSPHWGFTSAAGQLGGFDAEDLVHLGEGRYTAGDFTTAGYAHNIEPFSPIELYLAGFLGKDDVPDLLVAENAKALRDDEGVIELADNGYPIFTADSISTWTIEDIVAAEGERTPGVADAQKNFRAAAILLIDADHPATRETLETVSENVSWFSHAGADEFDGSYNFHEATGGRGTMTMDGLSGHLLPTAQPALADSEPSAREFVRPSLRPEWVPDRRLGLGSDAPQANGIPDRSAGLQLRYRYNPRSATLARPIRR